ncbi:MAG: hypothetical protein AAGD28_17065 [Bacteroidota bacterium]
MKLHYRVIQISFLSLVFLFLSSSVWSQADPEWLKSWEEAYEMKPAVLISSNRIAPKEEPGIPMLIKISIVNPDLSPANDVWIHAYHRDSMGFDFGPGDNATSTWRLQGWAITDKEGQAEFQTIRPAADHLGREGAHIHITSISDKFGRQWAPTVYLADDPALKESQRLRSQKAGKYGWVVTVEQIEGIQYIEVNIKLKEEADF